MEGIANLNDEWFSKVLGNLFSATLAKDHYMESLQDH